MNTLSRLAALGAVGLILGFAACSKDNPEPEPTPTPTPGGGTEKPGQKTKSYINPVYNVDSPDPSIQRGPDGTFYAFTTNGMRKSDDLINWTRVNGPFDVRPSWSEVCHDIWAYDCNEVDGRYLLYYALSKWGEGLANGIGVAVSDKIEGPYTDHGKLFTSSEIGVINSIDPQYFEEAGKKYLIWGSFNGLFYVELSDDGLSLAEGAKAVQIAGNAYEGVLVHKHEGKYYMFASTGSCCEGNNSTYTTVVGRSDSFFGPYVDRNGTSMMDNHHETVIKGNDRVKGPGHNSEIITDDKGTDWILYHGYMSNAPDNGRVLLMDQIIWQDGWPTVRGSQPSTIGTEGPSFGN